MAEFSFKPTSRTMPDGRTLFFVTEEQERFELAPWFECYTTAAEIAAKSTRADPHCDRIPACPVGSPVPRLPDTVFVPSKTVTEPPKRNPRNRR